MKIKSIAAAAILGVVGHASLTKAEPLTFEFSATYSSTFAQGDLSNIPSWATGIGNGATISGTLSFDPANSSLFSDINSLAISSAQFSVNLPGETLASQGAGVFIIGPNSISAASQFSASTGEFISAPPSHSILIGYSLSLVDPTGTVFTPSVIPTSFDLTQFSQAEISLNADDGTDTPNSSFFGLETVNFNITTISAVPEASTWAMMIMGFCGLGFISFQRRATLALGDA